MACEQEEHEFDYDPVTLARLLYPNLNLNDGLDRIHEEMRKKAEHEEFWSDPCWSEEETTH